MLLAMAGGVGVLSMAFLAERSWGVEERTLWNIPFRRGTNQQDDEEEDAVQEGREGHGEEL